MIRQSWKQVLGFLMLGVLIWAVLTLGVGFALPNQPLQGKGNCGEGFIAKDSSSPFEYKGDINICKVKIKAGSQVQGEACFTFKFPPSNQNDGCYNVRGLGSSSVHVGGGGTSDECKGISHVEFYACADKATDTPDVPTNTPTKTDVLPTETKTPTETLVLTETDTPTLTQVASITPISTQPLETPFETPFETPTPITSTPTDTSVSTTTPTVVLTPPNTLPPPPPVQKTQTPQVLLPETGFDGREISAGAEFEIAILALFSVLVLFIYVVRKKAK